MTTISSAAVYVIVARHEYFGPRVKLRLVNGEDGEVARFVTRTEAKEYVDHYDSDRYDLGHNESARPSYAIRKATGLPAHLAACLP